MADDDKPQDRTDRKDRAARAAADEPRQTASASERRAGPGPVEPEKGGKKRRRKRKNRDKRRWGREFPRFENFEDYMRMTMELCRDPATAGMASAVAETMLATIATGPSFAGMQSMLSANQANSLMYYNAVANQQMGNIVGMVTTMNCVQTLLGQDDLVAMPDLAMTSGLERGNV